MLEAARERLSQLARLSAEETGYGNWRDKYIKDRFVCEALETRLAGRRFVGVLEEDPGAGIARIDQLDENEHWRQVAYYDFEFYAKDYPDGLLTPGKDFTIMDRSTGRWAR